VGVEKPCDPTDLVGASMGTAEFLVLFPRGKKKRYTPPRFAHLTPEQARAVPVAKDLYDGRVVKQLLEWIAELENCQSEKK
jgi:hypothetical protein